MAVGNIDSNDRGTGARFNDGKLPMQLVPVRYWMDWSVGYVSDEVALALNALDRFERGNYHALREYLCGMDWEWLEAAVRVFDYGSAKYKAWNWAKGMPWSVPTGCVLRHVAALARSEDIDPESNLPHIGHIACNLIMLDWFVEGYPEGNDLPPPIIKTGAGNA